MGTRLAWSALLLGLFLAGPGPQADRASSAPEALQEREDDPPARRPARNDLSARSAAAQVVQGSGALKRQERAEVQEAMEAEATAEGLDVHCLAVLAPDAWRRCRSS